MAALTWYLTSASDQSGGRDLSETDPGTESGRTVSTGWTVGNASGFHSAYWNDAVQASSTFVDGAPPDGTLDNGAGISGDFWISPGRFSGTFANANWTVYLGVRAGVGANQQGRMRCRLFKGPNADGSSASELTSGQQQGGIVTVSTGATTVSSIAFNPTAAEITLTDEYIFVQLAWERTTAGNMTGSNVLVRIGNSGSSASRVVTADFASVGQPAAKRMGGVEYAKPTLQGVW